MNMHLCRSHMCPPVTIQLPPAPMTLREILGAWSAWFLHGWQTSNEVSVRRETSFQSGQIVQVGSIGRPGSAKRK